MIKNNIEIDVRKKCVEAGITQVQLAEVEKKVIYSREV